MKLLPLLTFSIIFICIVSFLLPEAASVFIFDREAILNGELWRLFSSHWVHFTDNHLIYNLFAFITAGWIIEKNSCYQFLLLYISMAFFICIVLLIFSPGMTYYGGLSGIACGLIYYCALLKNREQNWRAVCRFVIICIPIKIAIELYSNTSVLPYFGHQPFVIMPVSHIVGVVVAVIFYFVINHFQKPNKDPL